ncbi:MAG: tryptophan 7-halogenase [Thiomicrospira sp.]
MKQCDVFIIGGGPAGAIAGAKLVQAGFKVKLVERQVFPRFVIGESLLPRCNHLLEQANMLTRIEDANFQFKGGVAFEDEQQHKEIFHFANNLGEKHNSSFQVKREVFDHELLLEAQRLGVDVEFESEVIDFNPHSIQVTVKTKQGELETYQAKKVIDASGYGRVLPRLLNLETGSSLPLRRATFCRVENDVRPQDETDGYIYVYIHGDNDAWIWNIPFNDGITSVGIVCKEEYFQSFNMSNEAFWEHIIQSDPNASVRYKNARRINEVNALSGYSAAVTKLYGDHFVLVGNASEFLDPVFSSGVTLALESGSVAADLTIKQLQGEAVNWQTDYEDYMMLGINVFRTFVEAWYDGRLQTIFFHAQKDDRIKQAITSILSGYVWNQQNFFVRDSNQAVNTLVEMIGHRND